MDLIVYQNATVASTTVTMFTDVLKFLEVHVCFFTHYLNNRINVKYISLFFTKFYVKIVCLLFGLTWMFLWPNYVKPISSAIAKYVLDDCFLAISFKQLKSLAILNKNLYNFTR